jgi:adenylosuccinate synthase
MKICTAYSFGSEILDSFPSNYAVLQKCQPIYEELPGWEGPTSGIRDFAQLPSEARQYIKKLEKSLCCPAELISVGPRREQTIKVPTLG